jgi:hypothetical protein
VQMVGDVGMIRENFCLPIKVLFIPEWSFKYHILTTGTF